MPDNDLERGLATAARLAGDERELPADSDPVEQLDLPGLLGLPQALDSKTNVVPISTRKAGSRAGIPNLRTQAWLEYFTSRGYRLPIEIFMATANTGVDELARRLRCTSLEAMNIILRAAGEAAPLLHPRLASIEVKPAGEPGGRSSTLEIEGSLVTPENEGAEGEM